LFGLRLDTKIDFPQSGALEIIKIRK